MPSDILTSESEVQLRISDENYKPFTLLWCLHTKIHSFYQTLLPSDPCELLSFTYHIDISHKPHVSIRKLAWSVTSFINQKKKKTDKRTGSTVYCYLLLPSNSIAQNTRGYGGVLAIENTENGVDMSEY